MRAEKRELPPPEVKKTRDLRNRGLCLAQNFSHVTGSHSTAHPTTGGADEVCEPYGFANSQIEAGA